MIYSYFGSNKFLKDELIKKLVADFEKEHTTLAIDHFNGEEMSKEAVKDALSTAPFLTEKKMVIIKQLGSNKELSDKIVSLLEMTADTTDLVLIENNFDTKSTLHNYLKKHASFSNSKEIDERQLAQWAQEYAKKLGAALSATNALFLVDRIGRNQLKVAHELDKLTLFSKEITKEGIEQLVDFTPHSLIFAMLDAALSGDLAKMLNYYEEQKMQGTEPLALLGMITWQLHNLALTQAGAGLSVDEITSKTKLKPYSIQKNQASLRSISRNTLISYIDKAIEVDRQIKTSSVDHDDAIRNLLVSFAR